MLNSRAIIFGGFDYDDVLYWNNWAVMQLDTIPTSFISDTPTANKPLLSHSAQTTHVAVSTPIVAAVGTSGGLIAFWFLYGAISKFQLIGASILLDVAFPSPLLDALGPVAGLNLQIPLPWDDLLLGKTDSYNSRDLKNIDDYAVQTGIPKDRILISNLFWLAVMLLLSWICLGLITLLAPKLENEKIKNFLLYKRFQIVTAPLMISYFGLVLSLSIQLSLTETLSNGAGWIVLYVVAVVLLVRYIQKMERLYWRFCRSIVAADLRIYNFYTYLTVNRWCFFWCQLPSFCFFILRKKVGFQRKVTSDPMALSMQISLLKLAISSLKC
jgi:hypothetical protein